MRRKTSIARLFLYPVFFFVVSALCAGCATLSSPGTIPAYSIKGTVYYPLISLCESRGVELKYDTLINTVYLNKDSKRITLRAGDEIILVNDSAMHLDAPVDFHYGTVVVPRQFKEQVFDILFPLSVSAQRKTVKEKIKLKKIIIDPGHGGKDPGAIGKRGLREKDVNLDIAMRLNDLLRAEGVRTVLTRSSDRFIPLPTRVSITNKSDADLFVSLHANANRSRSLNGFEVYYVSPSVSDLKRAHDAARNVPLHLKNSVFARRSQDLESIVWDMIYASNRAESIDLAYSLCRGIGSAVDVSILGVKGARYQVLRGANIPAVLVEVGFVSNPGEERLLRSGAYRQRLAEGILEGLRRYSQDMSLVEVSER